MPSAVILKECLCGFGRVWILLHIQGGAVYVWYVQYCRPSPDFFVECQLCTGMIGPEGKTCNLLGETLLEVR